MLLIVSLLAPQGLGKEVSKGKGPKSKRDRRVQNLLSSMFKVQGEWTCPCQTGHPLTYFASS